METDRRTPTRRCRLATIAVGLGLWVLAVAAVPAAAREDGPAVVPFYPGLPDTLTRADAQRFGIYGDVEGLRRFWFLPAPWGGYLVRLETEGPDGVRLRERTVPRERWRQLRARAGAVLLGRAVPDTTLAPAPAWVDSVLAAEPGALPPPATAAADSVAIAGAALDPDAPSLTPRRVRVWPEVPLPPPGPRRPGAGEAGPRYPRYASRWLTLLEVGYRQNTTSFDEFFTGMVQFGLAFGYTVNERFLPYASFTVGFGDIRRDFEAIAGDGRANIYNLALGLTGRQPVSRRGSLYAGVEGGYFARTLQWGGVFQNPYTGALSDGYVLEQQDWGVAFRLGFTLQRAHPDKLRVWDLGVTYQITPADRWEYYGDDRGFVGDGRDAWLAISLRFWDTL